MVTAVCLTLFAGCAAPVLQPALPPRVDITVAPDTTGTCRTIGDALARAKSGDVILVKPGVYREQVRLAGVGHVTIVGLDPQTTVIDASGRYAAVEIRTDSNRISGLTLRNADSHGVWVRDGRQVIDRCLVVDNGDRGIYLSALAGNAQAVIRHCTVADNGDVGIYAARDSAGVIITDCIIAFNARGVVTDYGVGRMTVRRNCLFNRSADFQNVTPGDSNMVLDPRFADRDNGNYHLSRRSPCQRTGPDKANLGCF